LGERSTINLRVKRSSDLVYGANVNQPVQGPTYVTAAFQLKDDVAEERIIEFTRTAHDSGYTYHMDGKVML